MRSRILLLPLLFLLACLAQAAGSKPVVASLVAERTAIHPGRNCVVALRLVHAEGWHTYWKNPGEAGLPTKIKWSLPTGYGASSIQWPLPELIESAGIFAYGYSGDVLLPMEISVPPEAVVGSQVTLKANVEWLMCKESCVPGGAELELTLPIATASAPDAEWGKKLIHARMFLPAMSGRLKVEGYRNARDIELSISGDANTVPLAGPLAFFSDDGTVEPQPFRATALEGGRLKLGVKLAESAGQPRELRGLLVGTEGLWEKGRKAIVVRVPLVDKPPSSAASTPAPAAAATSPHPKAGSGPDGMAAILALALAGGLVLNLMPCVFPVLGIKILGFVQQAGSTPGKVRAHGLAFTVGVLISFWALAGGLIALRAGGAQLGWGYQLQVPEFVFALAAVMLIFALSLSGVFEIGGSLIGAGTSLQSKDGYAGSFFSGVLATVVATPCSAPLLAPALGAAIALPPVQSLAAFTAIALGLALPYLVLSFAPALIRVLPRPGAWMETFKQFMAFPLYATAGYLVHVLAGQVGDGLLDAVLGLTLVAMACWVLGRWATPVRTATVRRLARLAAVSLLVGGVVLGLPRAKADWIDWSPETVAKLREAGRIVYVDFTARWCVTCQANKKLVFGSTEVLETFKQLNVAKVRGDWTARDPRIAAELERFGRAAVPVNLVYLPGKPEPILLPEVLTPGTVLSAVKGGQ